MPATRLQRFRTYLRLATPVRRLMPNRTVRRIVQGTPLYLPWAHPLPDYARSKPNYGQNLVDLADQLHHRGPSERLIMLDVGANIGDSALQVHRRTNARVLCVEADPYWMTYLKSNVEANPDVVAVQAMLTEETSDIRGAFPVRGRGTSRFVLDPTSESPRRMSTSDLRAENPAFAALRLVKSDTDGFEPVLVPAIAETWKDFGPVLFFEFDPTLARAAGLDPNSIWTRLSALGYSRLAIWDNGADPLGQLDIAEVVEKATSLEPPPVHLGYHFWDVAACRGDDADALAAFDALMPDAYDVRGIWRNRPAG